LAPSGYGVGVNAEGRRRGVWGGAPPKHGCPFIGSGWAGVAGIGSATVVISAFMAVITGSEGAGGD
jgi:hypothetical protein